MSYPFLSTRARVLHGLAAAGLALALPAAAQAATSHGVVLSAGHGSAEVADASGAAHAYRLPHAVGGLRFGTAISYRTAGSKLLGVRTLGMAKRFSFTGRVASVHGHTLRLTVGQAHVSVNSARATGVASGDLVKVAERRAGHAWSAAVSVTKAAATTPAAGPRSTASGAITAIGAHTLTFALSNGSSLTTTVPADAVRYFSSNRVMRLCETAAIVYHATRTGAVLDALTPTGITTSPAFALPSGGNCATTSDGEVDVVGLISQLTSSSVTFTLPSGQRATWSLAPGRGLQSNQSVGDLADVTFDPRTGTAWDLESSELYTTGVVTQVSYWSMTIRDAVTGQTTTYPPDAAAYMNIRKGDSVGVVYWIDGGKRKADNVSDLTTGASN